MSLALSPPRISLLPCPFLPLPLSLLLPAAAPPLFISFRSLLTAHFYSHSITPLLGYHELSTQEKGALGQFGILIMKS